MKVRTTYLMSAAKYAAYFVALVLVQLFLSSKNLPVYIHAAFIGAELLLAWLAYRDWRTYRQIPADDATEAGWEMAERTMAPGGQKFVWLALAAGIAVIAIAWPRGDRYYPVGLLFGPFLLLLGIGGLFDRRIMVGMRKDRPEITPEIRRVSYMLLFVGLVIGGILVFLCETGRLPPI